MAPSTKEKFSKLQKTEFHRHTSLKFMEAHILTTNDWIQNKKDIWKNIAVVLL